MWAAAMEEKLAELLKAAEAALTAGTDPEQLRIKYLGKKGELTAILAGMGKVAPDERRAVGEKVNKAKAQIETWLSDAAKRADEAKLDAELKGVKLDVTLPGRGLAPGHRHPVARTLEDIVATFSRLGFD